jgi:hypothetical protein
LRSQVGQGNIAIKIVNSHNVIILFLYIDILN